MRIDEITEALPGQVGGIRRALARVGLGGRAAGAEKAMRDKAKQAYKNWLTVVPRIEAGKKANMSDPKTYSEYFGLWVAPQLRMDPKDPIIKNGVKELMSYGVNITKDNLINLIFKMMGQQRAAAFEPKKTISPKDGMKTRIKAGVAVGASDGQNYKLVFLSNTAGGGTEWHDMGDNRAPDAIQAELDSKYEAA